MSQPTNNQPNESGAGQPVANRAPASILLIGLFALLIYWGMIYLDAHGGGFNKQVYWPYKSWDELNDVQVLDPNDALRKRGKLVFANNCSACHQTSGLGVAGQFPPLAGSDWVNEKDPIRLTHLVMNGLQGPVKVSGKDFNNSGMVPWKSAITKDYDLAAVLTFVRGNKEWGNNAGPVSEELVKSVRDKTAKRDTLYTAEELLKIPLAAPDAK